MNIIKKYIVCISETLKELIKYYILIRIVPPDDPVPSIISP